MGPGTTKSGKTTDHYHQNSGIIPGFPMAKCVKYDYWMGTTNHQPLQMELVLQPFGKELGNFTFTFESFSAASPDPDLFTVGNIKDCEIGTDDQCSNVQSRMMALFGVV